MEEELKEKLKLFHEDFVKVMYDQFLLRYEPKPVDIEFSNIEYSALFTFKEPLIQISKNRINDKIGDEEYAEIFFDCAHESAHYLHSCFNYELWYKYINRELGYGNFEILFNLEVAAELATLVYYDRKDKNLNKELSNLFHLVHVDFSEGILLKKYFDITNNRKNSSKFFLPAYYLFQRTKGKMLFYLLQDPKKAGVIESLEKYFVGEESKYLKKEYYGFDL